MSDAKPTDTAELTETEMLAVRLARPRMTGRKPRELSGPKLIPWDHLDAVSKANWDRDAVEWERRVNGR